MKAARTPAFVFARVFAGDPAGVAAYVRKWRFVVVKLLPIVQSMPRS